MLPDFPAGIPRIIYYGARDNERSTDDERSVYTLQLAGVDYDYRRGI